MTLAYVQLGGGIFFHQWLNRLVRSSKNSTAKFKNGSQKCAQIGAKNARRTARRTARKTARRTARRTARKTARKTARRSSRRTAKKKGTQKGGFIRDGSTFF